MTTIALVSRTIIDNLPPVSLLEAVRAGDATAVDSLLRSGASVKIEGIHETAIRLACALGKFHVVKVLLDYGTGDACALHECFREEDMIGIRYADALLSAEVLLEAGVWPCAKTFLLTKRRGYVEAFDLLKKNLVSVIWSLF
mgnify:CR=1 FL=1